jgi:hypothetical protein
MQLSGSKRFPLFNMAFNAREFPRFIRDVAVTVALLAAVTMAAASRTAAMAARWRMLQNVGLNAVGSAEIVSAF